MKFLVIEGVDGSGKSTQIKLLRNHFEKYNVPYRYLHFPRTDTGIFGDLIARFLRGDLGKMESVNPYLIALIYAGDRKDASHIIEGWLKEGIFVLLDRYVYSNIAFQCAKVPDKKKHEELRNWILELEYSYNGIPKPDINILLDVPFEFTKKQLTQLRSGNERDYLQGTRDIHEEDLEFQKRVRDVYLWQAESCSDLKIIDCTGSEGTIRDPESIFNDIITQSELNFNK